MIEIILIFILMIICLTIGFLLGIKTQLAEKKEILDVQE